MPSTRKQLRDESQGFTAPYDPKQDHSCCCGDRNGICLPHWIVLGNFCELLIDLPFLVMGAIVSASFWRTTPLWLDMFAPHSADISSSWHRRLVALRHLWLLFCDVVLAAPFLLTLLTGIRTRALVRQLGKTLPRYSPLSAVKSLCCGVSNARTHIPEQAAVAQLQPETRATTEQKTTRVKEQEEQEREIARLAEAEEPAQQVEAKEQEQNRPRQQANLRNDDDTLTHSVVFWQFIALLLDIPCVIPFLLTIICCWRSPVLRRLLNQAKTDGQRRVVCPCLFLIALFFYRRLGIH
jgi:hypothetical protein